MIKNRFLYIATLDTNQWHAASAVAAYAVCLIAIACLNHCTGETKHHIDSTDRTSSKLLH